MSAYRLTQERARQALAELVKARLVLTTTQDALELPIHAEQQGTITNSSERVRRHRESKRNAETLHETPDVSVQRKERKKETNKQTKKADARAREQAAPANPQVAMLAEKLASSSRFADLPAEQVAEALVGKLGILAFQLDADKADTAIAAAALEAEEGADERRRRQLLGWKLQDAVLGRPGAKKQQQVQMVGDQTVDEYLAQLEKDKENAPWFRMNDSTSKAF
jgi:hypothetical protein